MVILPNTGIGLQDTAMHHWVEQETWKYPHPLFVSTEQAMFHGSCLYGKGAQAVNILQPDMLYIMSTLRKEETRPSSINSGVQILDLWAISRLWKSSWSGAPTKCLALHGYLKGEMPHMTRAQFQ